MSEKSAYARCEKCKQYLDRCECELIALRKKVKDLNDHEECLENAMLINTDWNKEKERADKVEKELATAKAENAMLSEAVWKLCECNNGAVIRVGYHSKECLIPALGDALSSSNALDYWQGEMRKAERKGIQKASDILFALHKYDKAAHILILELNQSNQSKGENLEPRGGS